MKISEIFYSIQAEGFLAGMPSVFIRLAGCPLYCRWCDTAYARSEENGTDCTIAEITKRLSQWQCHYVVVTGGEPMVNQKLQPNLELAELTQRLSTTDRHITIETAGLGFVPGLCCDLMSISPKLSSSAPTSGKLTAWHNRHRLNIGSIKQLISQYQYQLKFVVDSADDVAETEQVLKRLGSVDRKRVMLMPLASSREQFLRKSPVVVNWCKESGFAFGQRLQILLFDGRRGL